MESLDCIVIRLELMLFAALSDKTNYMIEVALVLKSESFFRKLQSSDALFILFGQTDFFPYSKNFYTNRIENGKFFLLRIVFQTFLEILLTLNQVINMRFPFLKLNYSSIRIHPNITQRLKILKNVLYEKGDFLRNFKHCIWNVFKLYFKPSLHKRIDGMHFIQKQIEIVSFDVIGYILAYMWKMCLYNNMDDGTVSIFQ